MSTPEKTSAPACQNHPQAPQYVEYQYCMPRCDANAMLVPGERYCDNGWEVEELVDSAGHVYYIRRIRQLHTGAIRMASIAPEPA